MAYVADKTLREQYVSWINSQPYDFDVAVSWHLPNSYKAEYRAYDDLALSNILRHYFNRLDRSVFRCAYDWKRIRLPRAIFLEHSKGVGWHAHGVISSQFSKLSQEQLIRRIESKWTKYLGEYGRRGRILEHLLYAEPRSGSYVRYISKDVTAADWDHSAKFDCQNSYLLN